MICYLDMDGVLTDFTRGAIEELGMKYDPNHPALMDYDWFEGIGATRQKVDYLCGILFWENLHWTPEGKAILEIVERTFGEENVFLLTTPMHNPGSWTGKRRWVATNMPTYTGRLIVTSAPKWIFAGKDRILIDDKESNCDRFFEAGGKSILVPRPWNRRRNTQVIPTILDELELFDE